MKWLFMIFYLYSFFCISYSIVLANEEIVLKTQNSKDIEFIILSGGDAFITVDAKETASEIQIQIQGDKPEEQIDQQSWNLTWPRSSSNKLQIHIQGPSKTMKLAWKNLNANINMWQEPIHIQSTKGKISMSDTKGPMDFFVLEGSISINKHIGAIALDTYNAQSYLNQIKGPLEIRHFQGDLLVKDWIGTMSLHSFNGKKQLEGGVGNIEINGIKGKISVVKHTGRVKAKQDDGRLQLKPLGEVDIHVKSKLANVALDMPNDSGARVFLKVDTKGGWILAPSFLEKSGNRLIYGNWSGQDGKGRVHVVSQAGAIKIQ